MQTITASNAGENRAHPDGSRWLNNRELAAMMTFLDSFEFKGPHILKQIGNSVVPMEAKAIFTHRVKHLHRTDLERDAE